MTQAAVGQLSDCGRMLQPITGFGLASGWEGAICLYALSRISYYHFPCAQLFPLIILISPIVYPTIPSPRT